MQIRKFSLRTRQGKFCYTVAQLLFLCKQARPDIEPLVLFLTTRIKELDKDDWGKLKHGFGYLKDTRCLKRHMQANSLSMIRWWVDASYAVHYNCKGHTRAMMSMGKSTTVNISRKHKLNTGSSTKSEQRAIKNTTHMH